MKLVGDGRTVGIAAGVGAVALGLAYMALAGAPARLLLMNLGALGIGLAVFRLATLLAPRAAALRGPALAALAVALLASTLGGLTVNGATRWVAVAGIAVQPSLIIVPLLVTAYASRPDRWAASALAIAVLASALQPDRSVAAMILLGIVVTARRGTDGRGLALGAIAALGFAAALAQPDVQPAMPYVDPILFTSFGDHPLAGLFVWGGIALLFAPAVWSMRGRGSPAAPAFAAVWGAAVLAAALDNYPTPLVGYGGSAIIGYMLSLLPLRRATASAAQSSPIESGVDADDGEQHLRFVC
jgi:cell division protein FtsW (lipid II flippase)